MSSYQNIAVNVPIEAISFKLLFLMIRHSTWAVPSCLAPVDKVDNIRTDSNRFCRTESNGQGLPQTNCYHDQEFLNLKLLLINGRHHGCYIDLTTLCLNIHPEDQFQGLNTAWSSHAQQFVQQLTGVDELANLEDKNPSWSGYVPSNPYPRFSLEIPASSSEMALFRPELVELYLNFRRRSESFASGMNVQGSSAGKNDTMKLGSGAVRRTFPKCGHSLVSILVAQNNPNPIAPNRTETNPQITSTQFILELVSAVLRVEKYL
ncbi:hypothetical protein GGU10DRAFT_329263 [Lentinula aff. detonsa]|uniref:Uncharacterized protein n=1 Tax=Lentinula aff. detonsa TaxID=2804958 RepID=A0AA38NSP2_9AGAR|nr:hypothetical protein GGU10DRAFT_329263 [Lentinula aff. detonsa]